MIKTFNTRLRAAVVLAVAGLVSTGAQAQEIAVKTGEKIAFLGDSITQQGAGTPSGYVQLVISGLAANGVKAQAIPAGISGHKSDQMLERLDRDVISKQPNWMTLSCGVNDVWHGERGIPLDQYKVNITKIVDKAQAANIKVVILTSTMIGEDQPNANNQKLTAYNDFLKSLAAERKLPVADLNTEMQAQVAVAPPHPGTYLTVDGVHMNPLGNMMMATGVLKAFGLNDAQLQTARNSWLDIPAAVKLSGNAGLTIRQYTQLRALADKNKVTVDNMISVAMNKAVDELLKQN